MRRLLVAICLLAGVLVPAATATATAPLGLAVEGGGDRWRHRNHFQLRWSHPQPELAASPTAYEIFNPHGFPIIGPVTVAAGQTTLELSNLLSGPGAYRLELRYLTPTGPGDAAPATLRFDDRRPAGATPRPPAAWVGRNSFPLRIPIRPPTDEPASGLSGYAVAVGPDSDAQPCRSSLTCAGDEVDVAAGVDPSFAIHDLPRGTSWIHVVAVSGSGMRSLEPGRGRIRVDGVAPRTALEGVPGGWVNHPVELTARAADDESGMAGDGRPPEPFTAIRIDGAAPRVAPGTAVRATVAGEGVHLVEHYARDEAGNVDDGAASNGRPNGAPGRAQVRIDDTPPAVAFAPVQDPADPELIVATVTDAASGPSGDGGSIAVRPAGSAQPFRPLPTRTADGTMRARWDASAVPPGLYEFRARGLDRAGNRAAGRARAGGRPMVLRAPLKIATAVELRRRGGRVLRGGRRPALRGQLSTAMGTAVPGAAVVVVERFAGGGERRRTSVASTRRDGSFAIALRRGPSRVVRAAFAGTATLGPARSRPAAVLVRPRLRLTASAKAAAVGGRPVVFRGRLAVPPRELPAEGKAIALEFRLRGFPWTAFRTVRTDRRGRFRLPYRFEDDDSRGAAFRFRAVAAAEPGWPYERAVSRAVTVRGR